MKRLSLFPKIFIWTISILLALVAVAHLSIYLVFPHFYLNDRQTDLSHKADAMVQNLAEVEEAEVETALEVYAKNEGITAFMQPQGSSYTKTLGRNLNYNQDSDQNSVIIEEREVVTRDKKRLLVQFVATTEVVRQATRVTLTLLPMSLGGSVALAVLVAYVYARSLSRPLSRMAAMTGRMKQLDRTAFFANIRQDELGMMERQINELYGHLLAVIDELEEKNQRMVELEKLKVDFLRSASHELKTPLAGLRIMLENMRWKVGKYADRDTYLDEAMLKVDQLSGLVKEILELSKLQEWQAETGPLDVAAIVPQVLADYEVLAQAQDLQIDCQLDRATLAMSESAFRKVFSNLMSNAVRYSTPGGTIRIYREGQKLRIENPCQPMSDQALQSAYDIFSHQDSDQQGNKGTGLGLYMVHNLLENYHIVHDFYAIEGGMRFELEVLED